MNESNTPPRKSRRIGSNLFPFARGLRGKERPRPEAALVLLLVGSAHTRTHPRARCGMQAVAGRQARCFLVTLAKSVRFESFALWVCWRGWFAWVFERAGEGESVRGSTLVYLLQCVTDSSYRNVSSWLCWLGRPCAQLLCLNGRRNGLGCKP